LNKQKQITNYSENETKQQVIRIVPKTKDDVSYLKELYNAQVELKLDFWQTSTVVGRNVDVMLATTSCLINQLHQRNINYTVIIDDVQMFRNSFNIL
jgi:hypothetical protein